MSHKDKQIIVLIEPELKDLAARLASSHDKSLSSLVRGLIVKELLDQDMLTDTTLRSIIS